MSACKLCSKEISPLENNLYSGYCESCYEKIYSKNSQEDNYSKTNSRKNNIVATILKSISIINIIICIIGLIIGGSSLGIDLVTAVTIIIVVAVSSIFIYALGEIIQLLEDIKNK